MKFEFGLPVVMRDVETLDELARVTAPAPVRVGDLVASADAIYRVEVVLLPSAGARVVPVLARRLELAIDSR